MSDIKIITNHSKIADKESNIEEYVIDSNQAPNYAMNSPIYREMLRHEKEMKRLVKESGDLLHLLHPDNPGGCNGIAHSNNPAHYCDHWHNFFPHRSEHEVKLHKAFQKINHQLAKKYGKTPIQFKNEIIDDKLSMIADDLINNFGSSIIVSSSNDEYVQIIIKILNET